MMEFSVVEQDLKPMWLSEFPHWGFAHVYTILGGVWKATEPSFPYQCLWMAKLVLCFWWILEVIRGKSWQDSFKKWICSVFSWDVVELDEDGIGTMWKYVKGTISGIFGTPRCAQGEMYFVQFDPCKPLPWGVPWLDHWWHMFGMSQAATSCQMV